MFFPEGTIYVAVVDAGVGTDRRVLGATRFWPVLFSHRINGLLSFLVVERGTFISIPVPPGSGPLRFSWPRRLLRLRRGRLSTGGSLESLGTAITDPVYAPLPISVD